MLLYFITNTALKKEKVNIKSELKISNEWAGGNDWVGLPCERPGAERVTAGTWRLTAGQGVKSQGRDLGRGL